MLSFIPLPYRVLIGAVLLFAAYLGGLWQGYHSEKVTAQLQQSQAQLAASEAQAATFASIADKRKSDTDALLVEVQEANARADEAQTQIDRLNGERDAFTSQLATKKIGSCPMSAADVRGLRSIGAESPSSPRNK